VLIYCQCITVIELYQKKPDSFGVIHILYVRMIVFNGM